MQGRLRSGWNYVYDVKYWDFMYLVNSPMHMKISALIRSSLSGHNNEEAPSILESNLVQMYLSSPCSLLDDGKLAVALDEKEVHTGYKMYHKIGLSFVKGIWPRRGV